MNANDRPGRSRRRVLQAAAAACLPWGAGVAAAHSADDTMVERTLPGGVLQLVALSARAVRVRFVPAEAAGRPPEDGTALVPRHAAPQLIEVSLPGGRSRWHLPEVQIELDAATGALQFFDRRGRLLLAETAGTRRLLPARLGDEDCFIAEQAFDSPTGESLFGTGCFQDGALDVRGLPRRLTQVNTQISLPFVLSSRRWGLAWLNPGMSEWNPPEARLTLTKTLVDGRAKTVDVTTTVGTAQVLRREATFEAQFETDAPGRHAFLLDVGRPMGSRHFVEIDARVCVDIANHWLPPTVGFTIHLPAGRHQVRVIAGEEDLPVLHHGPVSATSRWRSPVAQAVDYVVIAGDAAAVMAGWREIAGAAPMFPRWAYGYIHCRERFTSSAEILETAREFRRRSLPMDVIVQDWQYWGPHGWNAMRFDEAKYPDPAGLVRDLHGLDMRLMLSVWSKLDRASEVGQAAVAGSHLIEGTDWVDFFSPRSAAFYWQNQKARLGGFGVDAWWQDATEPENDDLVGRRTAAGAGERVRNVYPWYVTRTVYQGQREATPDKRVMILTRCAALGQHRHAAATWSGDIGSDWDALKRQIPAGLNMAAAGYPYWTVDAGGFFRPGEAQYTDRAYHERLLRWMQYATFLPLQRVHGYMSRTEFWHYGAEVEAQARRWLELRYRLLPYIYGLAADVTRRGLPMMRPLVFDFADDPQALAQSHSYLFGPALHVAPVFAPVPAQGQLHWPVYLPRTAGGWVDFWTGERRAGGRVHEVPAPLERMPLHLRAGSILPLGPVLQSSAQARSDDVLDLCIVPGSDGRCELYEDDGLDNGYERGSFSLVRAHWDDRRGVLRLAQRIGSHPGMARTRRFRLHRIGPANVPSHPGEGLHVEYDGRPLSVRLVGGRSARSS